MEQFLNDYREPTFEPKVEVVIIDQEVTLKTIEPTKAVTVARVIVGVKRSLLRLVKAPSRVRVVRISNPLPTQGKRGLEASIVTETRYYKNRQTIDVKTDIKSRYLRPIHNEK
jgi:hypothetical protein